MKAKFVYEGMFLDLKNKKIKDHIGSAGDILRSRPSKTSDAYNISPYGIGTEGVGFVDYHGNPIKIKLYSYERLTPKNLKDSNIKFSDIKLLNNDPSAGIYNILQLLKYPGRHSGLKIGDTEIEFSDDDYWDFVENAAFACSKVLKEEGVTPQYILTPESKSDLAYDLAETIKELYLPDAKTERDFFKKRSADELLQMVNNGVFDERIRTYSKDDERKFDTLKNRIISNLRSAANEAKKIDKRMSKFFIRFFDTEIEDEAELNEMFRGADILVVDDIFSSSATTVKNVAHFLSQWDKINSVTYFAAVSVASS